MRVRDRVGGVLRWLLRPPPAPLDIRQQGSRLGTGGPTRDDLLSVNGPAAARAALDAAESVVVVDGRATAWSVLADLAHLGAFIGLIAVLGRDTVTVAAGFLVFMGLLVLSDICQRVSGVQLKPARGRVIVAGLVVGLAAVAAMIVLDLPASWFLGFLAACVVGGAMAPLVRWGRSGRRGGQSTWGPGTEAFAMLTVLDSAEAIMPSHLIDRAGLDPTKGESWIERLREERAIMGGQQRRRPLGRDWIRITDTGRELLARLRSDLEGQAAARVPVR